MSSSRQSIPLLGSPQASSVPMDNGQFSQDSNGTAQWVADTGCLENPLEMITLEAPDDLTTTPGPVVMKGIG